MTWRCATACGVHGLFEASSKLRLTVALPLCDCTVCVPVLSARLFCWRITHSCVPVLQEYHVMKILLGNKLEAMEQQFEDIHKVCELQASPYVWPVLVPRMMGEPIRTKI